MGEKEKEGNAAAAAAPPPPAAGVDNLLLADAAAAAAVGAAGGNQQQPAEALNRKALDIIQRVRDKLTGRDFDRDDMLDIAEQVGREGEGPQSAICDQRQVH